MIPVSVGSKLREARERQGVSLRAIANRTKISITVLEALERNDISHLPGGIFGRGFVRSYAVEVGLDPESTIQEFIAQFPNDSVTAGHPTSVQHDDNEKLESDRRMASTFIKLVGASLAIAGVLLYVSGAGRRQPVRHVATSPRAVDTSGSQPVAKAVAADEKFAVVISASGPSFVSATVDGQHTVEREMRAGEHEELTVRREVVLTAADAGVVSLTLDGAAAKPLGNAGASATLRLTIGNFRDDLAPR